MKRARFCLFNSFETENPPRVADKNYQFRHHLMKHKRHLTAANVLPFWDPIQSNSVSPVATKYCRRVPTTHKHRKKFPSVYHAAIHEVLADVVLVTHTAVGHTIRSDPAHAKFAKQSNSSPRLERINHAHASSQRMLLVSHLMQATVV